MKMYRVLRESKLFSKTETAVIWEGSDIRELSRKYPPSKIFGADPLGYQQLEGGYISHDYHFEQLVGDIWTEIEDPRIRLQKGLSIAEQEIDRENRRLFPGDYL